MICCMQDGSVHDYMFDQESCDWVHWMKTVPHQELPPTLAFHEIIVQTIDTVRYSYLMRLLITHGHHTLFTGVPPLHSCNTCYYPHCCYNMNTRYYCCSSGASVCPCTHATPEPVPIATTACIPVTIAAAVERPSVQKPVMTKQHTTTNKINSQQMEQCCHCRCDWYWQDSLYDVSDQCIGQQCLPEHPNSLLSTDKRQPDSGHH